MKDEDIDCKIAGLITKMSQVNRILLWEMAKQENLTPTQIRLLDILRMKGEDLCCVNDLAEEMDLTQPTVSDAVKTLDQKKLIKRKKKKEDKRVTLLNLTDKGRIVSERVSAWSQILIEHFSRIDEEKKERIIFCLMEVVRSLWEADIISEARICLNCRHFERRKDDRNENIYFCRYYDKFLENGDLKCDCEGHGYRKTDDD